MRQTSLWVCVAVLAGIGPAAAQLIQPLTTQQLQQQNQATIQNSTQSLQQGMTQIELGQIEQRQREQQLFNSDPNHPFQTATAPVVVTPPAVYVMPPPPAPPPPP